MTRMHLLGCAAAVAVLAPLNCATAHSATETVLYSFCGQTKCSDGATPFATLVVDGSGNLYGTTYEGGSNNDGEVFELAADGTLTVLHSFAKRDGARPHAGVVMDGSGNLYGTTSEGGHGYGTVFKLAPDGTFSDLYEFNGSDGSKPLAGLLLDGSGNLYGTTVEQSGGDGLVFEVAADGTEKTLYRFCSVSGCADGAAPYAPLIMDRKGNLYGTAAEGGLLTGSCTLGCGTVFELKADGSEKTLYAFQDGADGATPIAGLLLGNGTLVGVAAKGGNRGDGTAFSVDRQIDFHSLHEFAGKGDAEMPLAALIPDGNGGFYGTACVGGEDRHGAVFDISATGDESVVYSFSGRSDGSCPESSLVNVNGTLYGTTAEGGGKDCHGNGCGTVFAIKE